LPCSAFLSSILIYRLYVLRTNLLDEDCHCGVPTFGKNYEKDTGKGAFFLILALASSQFDRPSHVGRGGLTLAALCVLAAVLTAKSSGLRPMPVPRRKRKFRQAATKAT
jgi:hypothetical protein